MFSFMFCRCTSPEPYATTPLITDYKGTIHSGKFLPPNIPVGADHKMEDARLLNFNTISDKGSYCSLVLDHVIYLLNI